MIDSFQHAAKVQTRRRAAGKKGRAKAVRRWFRRAGHGPAVEATGPSALGPMWAELDGNFTGCRSYEETYGKGS